MHKIDLSVPALQRPLASSTPVYGHDYAQEGQGEELHPWENAPSSPNSSQEERGPTDPQQPRSGDLPNSEDSSEDPLQEQPFDGDPPLFPETIVRRKKQTTPHEAEKRSSPASKPTAGDTGNEHVE